MEFINGQNILEILSFMISKTWLLFLLGALHLLIIEHKIIYEFLRTKKRDYKMLKPLLYRMSYLILGLLLIYGSWTLSNLFTSLLVPSHFPVPDISTVDGTGLWSMLKYQSGSAGLIGVIFIVFGGFAVLLSAGGRWLVNLGKFFITCSVIYFVLTVFAMYG